MKKQTKWLDNYGETPNANESNVTLPEGFVGMGYDTSGRKNSPAWGGQFQTGGSIPGTPGFTYARTAGSAPSEGKYAKKTMPSAQDGKTTVATSSPEYKQLYENRQIGRWLDDYNFDSQVPLDEVTVIPQSYSMQSLRDFTKAAMYGAPENLMKLEQVPTAALAETAAMLTGKPYDFSNINPNFGQWGSNQRDLSILGYENPEGFMQNAVNMGLSAIDPAMIVGLTRNPVKNLTRTFTDNLNYSKSINPTRYVAGDEIKPAFGYATRNNETVVRGDLPEKVKNFVQAHEDYHVYDFQKYPNSSDSFFRRELPANFFPALKDPIGFAATVKHSLTPERLSFYKKRLKENLKPTSSVDDVVTSGIDSNFLTRPLTPFTKNELTQGKHLYRKIGGNKGLEDLINKGGAQAPAPLKMKSGLTVDTPFFGVGNRPVETYSGIFAVETPLPSMSKYNWSNRVGGTNNYGVAPFDRITGQPIQNIPLDDLEVFRKKWFSNNYKKLDKQNLQKELKSADLQELSEKLYKWGIRGYLADQILNDGDLTGGKAIERIEGHFKNNDEFQNGGEMKFYQEGLDWKPKSMQDGGIVEDDMGYWNPDNRGKPVRINSNMITMEGVDEPLLGIDDTGDTKLMLPGENYKFKGEKVTEYPITNNAENGRKLAKAQNGKNIAIDKDFMKDWTNSPMHLKMLNKSTRGDYDSILKGRKENIETTKVTYKEGDRFKFAESDPNNGEITIYNKDPKMQQGLYTHEMSHSSDRPIKDYNWYLQNLKYNWGIDKTIERKRAIPQSDIDLINKFRPYDFEGLPDKEEIERKLKAIKAPGREITNEEKAGQYMIKHVDYIAEPTETRARLNDLRQRAYQYGIYNPFEKEINIQQYKKLLETPSIRTGTSPLNDLKSIYTDDEIMHMLNTISENKKQDVSNELPKAKNGGSLGINQLDAQPKKKLNQLLNFTNNPDKNWLDNL
jgi:hypothetical protein